MERVLRGGVPATWAVSEQARQDAVRVGRSKLESLVKAHNRSVPRKRALLLGRLLWPPAAVLALALCYYRLSVSDACYPRPLLEPQAWSEEFRRARTFDGWSAKMMQRSEAASHGVRLEYTVIADLGPTYTKKYRGCLNRHGEHECNKLHLTRLYVIQPAGFQKAVMLAHAKHGAKHGRATGELRRMSPLLQSLEVEKAMRNRKDVSSIDRSASSSSRTGDWYYFDRDSQVLLPLAVDLVDSSRDAPLSCIGTVVGDHGVIPLAVAVLLLAWRIRAVKKCGELPSAVTLEQALCQVATPYMGMFDHAWSMEDVGSLILEDVGLSEKFGVLEEDDTALLSQNWIFCGDGESEFFAAGVHIRTTCEKRRRPPTTSRSGWVVADGFTGGVGVIQSKKVRGLLKQRLKNPTWKDFQVLRQVDLLLFKSAGDGGVLRIDPVTSFPHPLTGADWQLMRQATTNLAELFTPAPRGEEPPSCEVCPECVVTGESAPLFALVERHIYSWHALREFIVDQGTKVRSDEMVASGPDERDVSCLQVDPLKRIIHKSPKVDFGMTEGGHNAPEQEASRLPQEMQEAMLQQAMLIHLRRQVWLQPQMHRTLSRELQEREAAVPWGEEAEEKQEEEEQEEEPRGARHAEERTERGYSTWAPAPQS